jgi:hypothetical protein
VKGLSDDGFTPGLSQLLVKLYPYAPYVISDVEPDYRSRINNESGSHPYKTLLENPKEYRW